MGKGGKVGGNGGLMWGGAKGSGGAGGTAGTWKGFGKKGDGGMTTGKGYQGVCFKCGQVGHKAHEAMCPLRRIEQVVEDDKKEKEACAVCVPSVWPICQITHKEAEEEDMIPKPCDDEDATWEEVMSKKRRKKNKAQQAEKMKLGQ